MLLRAFLGPARPKLAHEELHLVLRALIRRPRCRKLGDDALARSQQLLQPPHVEDAPGTGPATLALESSRDVRELPVQTLELALLLVLGALAREQVRQHALVL